MSKQGQISACRWRHNTLRKMSFVLVCLILCAWVQVPAAAKKDRPEKGAEQEKNITVKLKADFQTGFSPLSITFTGRIKNMDLDDDRFCHMGTLLVRKLVTGFFETVAGEDPVCLHDLDKQEISPTFSIRHVILNAGTYEFFAMVVTRNGRRIISNGVPVRVVAGVER